MLKIYINCGCGHTPVVSAPPIWRGTRYCSRFNPTWGRGKERCEEGWWGRCEEGWKENWGLEAAFLLPALLCPCVFLCISSCVEGLLHMRKCRETHKDTAVPAGGTQPPVLSFPFILPHTFPIILLHTFPFLFLRWDWSVSSSVCPFISVGQKLLAYDHTHNLYIFLTCIFWATLKHVN